jgi:hypothetical protein
MGNADILNKIRRTTEVVNRTYLDLLVRNAKLLNFSEISGISEINKNESTTTIGNNTYKLRIISCKKG